MRVEKGTGIPYDLLEEVLGKLEGWYESWHIRNSDGSEGVGGLVATLWNSSWYTCLPHVLNVTAVVRGLCHRAGDKSGQTTMQRAAALVKFLMNSQDPVSGYFVPAWGDIPYRSTGLIHQTMAAAALWDFYGVAGDEDVKQAATKAYKVLDKCAGWNVVNQVLRHLETTILMLQVLDESDDEKSRRYLQDTGKRILSLQFHEGKMKGAYPQGWACDNIYSCYQGKCLSPLINIGQFLGQEIYIASAIELADFIERELLVETEFGPLLGYGFNPAGVHTRKWQKAYKLRKVFSFTEKILRHQRILSIDDWQYYKYPVWVARSADTAFGLFLLYEATEDKRWLSLAVRMTHAIVAFQTPLGGIRNTMGFFGGEKNTVWQDIASVTRWNAYVIHLFHYLLKGRKVKGPCKPASDSLDEVILKDGKIYVETMSEVFLKDHQNTLFWKVRKGHHWGRPRIPYKDWDEGACQGRSPVKSRDGG